MGHAFVFFIKEIDLISFVGVSCPYVIIILFIYFVSFVIFLICVDGGSNF